MAALNNYDFYYASFPPTKSLTPSCTKIRELAFLFSVFFCSVNYVITRIQHLDNVSNPVRTLEGFAQTRLVPSSYLDEYKYIEFQERKKKKRFEPQVEHLQSL